MNIRLLDTGASRGSLNMGIDEAVLLAVSRGESPPTLRFYSWSPTSISVGYFQSMEDEIDLAACRALGIDAVRRITGGGAVFHDAEVTYSIVLPAGQGLAHDDILASYRAICAALVRGLSKLGIAAEFSPINDITASGRKVSGNAQTRKHGCLLQHGTVLLDVDVERMFSLLKVPSEKLKGKLIEDVKARVGSLRALLGRPVPYDEAASALAAGFAEVIAEAGDTLEKGELSASELEAARRIALERFSSDAWNLRR
jgi:lipoate-protein ligase A